LEFKLDLVLIDRPGTVIGACGASRRQKGGGGGGAVRPVRWKFRVQGACGTLDGPSPCSFPWRPHRYITCSCCDRGKRLASPELCRPHPDFSCGNPAEVATPLVERALYFPVRALLCLGLEMHAMTPRRTDTRRFFVAFCVPAHHRHVLGFVSIMTSLLPTLSVSIPRRSTTGVVGVVGVGGGGWVGWGCVIFFLFFSFLFSL